MPTPSMQQLALIASHKLERFLHHQSRGNYGSLTWTTELDRLLREYIDALQARDDEITRQRTQVSAKHLTPNTLRLALLAGTIVNCQSLPPAKELPANYPNT